MKNIQKKEKQNNFEAWVATLDERIYDWLCTLNKEQRLLLDFSIDSLDVVERHLINRYKIEDLSNVKFKYSIDGAASYVYKVFKIHLPNYKCITELNNERDVLFNLPAITTEPPVGMPFSPYFYIPSIINLKRVGDFKFQLLNTRRKYDELIMKL